MTVEAREIAPIPAIAVFLDRVSAHFGARYLYTVLYGSHARGDATTESDIDLLVVLSSIADYEEDWEYCINVACEIASDTGDLLSTLVCSSEDYEKREHPLLINVRNEGVILR